MRNILFVIIVLISFIAATGCGDPTSIDGTGNTDEDGGTSNTILCHTLDPFTYESGSATQIINSTDYDLSQCSEYNNINVSGIAQYHQNAVRITGIGLMEVFDTVQAGMIENDFKVILDRVFSDEGGSGLAFDHIVASGPNSLNLHYSGNSRLLKEGDVLLVDVGSKYNGYCADITRTIPVSGTFTDRQKEIYELVLEVQTQAAQKMKPGVHSLSQMTEWAINFFRNSPLRAKDTNGVERTMDYFFQHSLCHYVGKKVHGQDTGWDEDKPIKEGQIFTIEPGLYLEREKFGIRIEDDYIVTSDGVTNLFKNIPKTVEDLENVLSQSRKKYILDRSELLRNIDESEGPNRHMEF